VPKIKHHCPYRPFILAGNKLDLLHGEDDESKNFLLTAEKKSIVSYAEVLTNHFSLLVIYLLFLLAMV
jgi:hypothetical protein